MEPLHDSIKTEWLDRGHLFGMRYKTGIIFAEVLDCQDIKYKPYTGIGDVEPRTATAQTRLKTGGDDILYIPDNKRRVLHVGIGHKPVEMKRYTIYPETGTRIGKFPNLQPPNTSGDKYGWIDGTDSPYDNPSASGSLLIPPDIHPMFSYWNPNPDDPEKPILNIVAREYDINIIDPNENPDEVKRIVKPGNGIPIYNIGSLNNRASYSLERQWGVTPKTSGEVL